MEENQKNVRRCESPTMGNIRRTLAVIMDHTRLGQMSNNETDTYFSRRVIPVKNQYQSEYNEYVTSAVYTCIKSTCTRVISNEMSRMDTMDLALDDNDPDSIYGFFNDPKVKDREYIIVPSRIVHQLSRLDGFHRAYIHDDREQKQNFPYGISSNPYGDACPMFPYYIAGHIHGHKIMACAWDAEWDSSKVYLSDRLVRNIRYTMSCNPSVSDPGTDIMEFRLYITRPVG